MQKKLDETILENDALRLENTKLTDSLSECTKMIRSSLADDTENNPDFIIAQLCEENQTLRNLLNNVHV
ncbi:hypothetical protein BC833DRAFT_601074 [Globomyces pollinis-pini]|nr:hypothetical protein BC833DRAFT_601074 [Globomyces pollinis-pini]